MNDRRSSMVVRNRGRWEGPKLKWNGSNLALEPVNGASMIAIGMECRRSAHVSENLSLPEHRLCRRSSAGVPSISHS